MKKNQIQKLIKEIYLVTENINLVLAITRKIRLLNIKIVNNNYSVILCVLISQNVYQNLNHYQNLIEFLIIIIIVIKIPIVMVLTIIFQRVVFQQQKSKIS